MVSCVLCPRWGVGDRIKCALVATQPKLKLKPAAMRAAVPAEEFKGLVFHQHALQPDARSSHNCDVCGTGLGALPCRMAPCITPFPCVF